MFFYLNDHKMQCVRQSYRRKLVEVTCCYNLVVMKKEQSIKSSTYNYSSTINYTIFSTKAKSMTFVQKSTINAAFLITFLNNSVNVFILKFECADIMTWQRSLFTYFF